jgi:cytochrome c peroxidase
MRRTHDGSNRAAMDLRRAAAVAVLAVAVASLVTWMVQQRRRDGEVRFVAPTAAVMAPPPTLSLPATPEPLARRVALGRALFFDPGLSEPSGTSCASCHDPAHGYAGDNGSSLGVPRGSRPGHFARRAAPSVLYMRFIRRFHFEWPEDAEHPEAYGGFFWDGRSSSIADLVRQPLLNSDEMGNHDVGRIAAALERGGHADELRREFDGVFDSPEQAMAALGASIEAFLTSPTMAPFASRFDAFVRGDGTLDPIESRGLALFEDPDKGNCAACHRVDWRSHIPERSLFTDYGYETVAVPRNRRLRADKTTFDLGVCERHDRSPYTDQPHFCGAFRTPSLRNVAVRSSFMHNGAFTSLRDVVEFYATRGTTPRRWYPTGTYDDLPEKFRANVDVSSPPYDRREGDGPALDEGEVDAIVAFLGTLTDLSVPP